MNKSWLAHKAGAVACAICFSLPAGQALAVTPSPFEFGVCQNWADRTLAVSPAPGPVAYLKLLYQDVPDGLSRGRSWRRTPFQLGEKTYAHGLAFNSTKHLLVHLARPATRFTADVGLENNDDTRRGEAVLQGSVVFHVLLAGREVFSSPILRRKDGPKPLDVDLRGADEFQLRVTDGGDGRGWDQALWAEAVITLDDGSQVRLQDLPLEAGPAANPFGFSFRCAGTNSQDLLPQWPHHSQEESLPHGSKRIVSWQNPGSGLQARLEITRWTDFPAVEWVAWLANTGSNASPLLENVQGLDASLLVPASGAPMLHWSRGAVASFDDFAPQTTSLKTVQHFQLASGEGRSSSQVLPFFNVEGAGGGAVIALGWSGSWAADFAADSGGQVSIRAGQERTHLVLQPGESIRTPRMLALFYQGDNTRGQNLLRQFILAHHRPTPSGKPLVAPITCGNWGGTRADVHLDNIRQIIRHELPIDYYWIDAEWFGDGGWPINVGDWQVKTNLYPRGFKPLSDALRQSGRQLMLWFEPERVYKNTAWYREHHDYLLDIGGDNALLNLGNPAARKFLTDFISQKIDEFGLGCYRQDFNINPAPFWQKADKPDRQGITENLYIQGLYAFWDELLAQHPGLLIDNCASGGRRIDLETVGRATPFWRTDGPRDPIAHQCHSYGLLAWVPFSATSQDRPGDNYEFRSSMCSSLCLNWWVAGDVPGERIPADFPYPWARKTLQDYIKYRGFYYGDYYPLTGYSQATDVWMAYQLDRPETGSGMVVVLRRPDSPYESARLRLKGLAPEASYHLANLDTGKEIQLSGKMLSDPGLEVRLARPPASELWLYEKAANP